MSDQLVVITCPLRRLHATARRRGRARRLIIAEGETCDAPVTAGRATTGSAIGATPLSNVVKLISERDWAGACFVSRRSELSPREGRAMNRGEPPAPLVRQRAAAARLTPGRGDFPFRDFNHAPSDKNLSKNGSVPIKGVGFSVKDAFAKKFFGAGRDSADGALAPVGNTLLKAGHRAQRAGMIPCLSSQNFIRRLRVGIAPFG